MSDLLLLSFVYLRKLFVGLKVVESHRVCDSWGICGMMVFFNDYCVGGNCSWTG